MKGVKIERAYPNNFIDVYALFKAMVKEGNYIYPQPTDAQIKDFCFRLLTILAEPNNLIYVARKGRQYLGFIYGMVVPRDFGPAYTGYVRMVYTDKKKRSLGVGKALADTLSDAFKELGIKTVEFSCHDDLQAYWSKKRGAKKVLNLMAVDL